MSLKKQTPITPTASGQDIKQITNDPRSVNVLAYALGGAVLLGTFGQIYYNVRRINDAKAHKN